MIDFSAYSQDEIIAKGHYSIVRAAHEDEKKRLSLLCGQFATISSQVLRQMQPDSDAVPDMYSVRGLIAQGRALLDQIDRCSTEIEELADQRAALKSSAWGR